MNLKMKWKTPGCADGTYTVRARGYLLAALRWGRKGKPLENWTPFAYVPIDPYGNGSFRFTGGRAIPVEADCVHALCVSPDFLKQEEGVAEIPEQIRRFRSNSADSAVNGGGSAREPCDPRDSEPVSFSLLCDMHLTKEPWRFGHALQMADSEIVLLTGDMTNDGISEQFALLRDCIGRVAGEKLLFPVAGNHDIPRTEVQKEIGEDGEYFRFQKELLDRNGTLERRYPCHVEECGAYSVQIGQIDLIGLQCVTSGRKFLFPKGEQMDWLSEHLKVNADAWWHIILCHAPLLAHSPQRQEGSPYLDQNRRLQEIVDSCGRIIFLSGHTHISPNVPQGCVDYDPVNQNIYVNGGSVVLTDAGKADALAPAEWKDGLITELSIGADEVEIRMRSVNSGRNISRGYYNFSFK